MVIKTAVRPGVSCNGSTGCGLLASRINALGTAESGPRCEIVTSFDRLEELSAEWDRLWQADPRAEIFQSFAWARAWWQSFGAGLKLCTPVVYERDEVVLILPLVQRADMLGFLGAPQADYCDVLCAEKRTPELLAVALRVLLQFIPAWKECVLQNLPPHGRITQHWPELPREFRRLVQSAFVSHSPTILFEGKKKEILDPLLQKKHLRRRLNKLGKAGLVRFRHIETRTEAQRHLTQFFQCQRRRYALLAKTSCFEEPQMRRFMLALLEQLDLCSELRFGVLELDGWPLAWSFAFHTKGKFVFYQQTFDVDAAEYNPGEVLWYYLLLYAKEKVDREFDFVRGDEFFKSRFANHTRQLFNLYFERPGIQGRLRRLWRAAQDKVNRIEGRIERVARRHESAVHLFRSIRVWRTDVLRRIQHL
jgi:CelD/BcsL family acetyltransferase involved in cellulose biosynthesis